MYSASEGAYSGRGSPLQRAVQKARNPDTDFSACVAMIPSIVVMSPHGPAASHVTTAVTCTCAQTFNVPDILVY